MARVLISWLYVSLGLLLAVADCFGQRVDPDRAEYVVGERVVLQVGGAPGSGTDWVGIFPVGTPSSGEALYWQYLQGGGEPSGSGPSSATLRFLPMSLPKGEYEARLFFRGERVPRATAHLRVVEAGPDDAPAPRGDLTVLCFNIWVQGARGHGGLDEVVRVIASTRADLIALQECNAETLGRVLEGLRADPFYADAVASGRTSIISRFPIVEEYTGSGLRGYGVRIALPDGLGEPGEHVRLFNSHLTPYPYGPYELRDGKTVDQVLDIEQNTRGGEMLNILAQLVQHRAKGSALTTFLVGDHNCPSHLDWGPENANQNFDTVVAWPVSTLLHAFGFVDSYRAVHPDVLKDRALTWSPGYPKGQLDRRDVHDRIDMVYHRAASGRYLKPVQAYVLDRDPWPSDHRAVVVSYSLSRTGLQRAVP